MQQSPYWLQWPYYGTPQIHPRELPFTFDDHSPLSNTPIPQPTPLTTPNGIWGHSAVLPQYTFWTHRQTDMHTHRETDRWDKRQVYSNSIYTLLIVSDVLIIILKPMFVFVSSSHSYCKSSACLFDAFKLKPSDCQLS